METLKLEANYRSDMSKSRMKQLRKDGYVTASVFGHDAEPIAIELKLEEFARQAKHAEAGVQHQQVQNYPPAPEVDKDVVIREYLKKQQEEEYKKQQIIEEYLAKKKEAEESEKAKVEEAKIKAIIAEFLAQQKAAETSDTSDNEPELPADEKEKKSDS